MSWRRQVRVLGYPALAPPHGAHLVVRGAGDLHVHAGNEIRRQPTDTHKGDVFAKRMEPIKFETALDLFGLRRK